MAGSFIRRACVLGAMLTSASGMAHPGDQTGPMTVVTIDVKNDTSEAQRLSAEGFDVAGVDREAGTIDVITKSREEGLTLQFLGYKVRGMKEVDPTIAPDANYKTPDEIQELVQRFGNDFPGLTRVESIGKSSENRDIWAIKITDNPERRELEEPTILFNAMHHAREIMTPEIALDTIEYLLTRYGTDPQVTRWVNSNEIWIVPMLNPDGNNKVWTSNSMWRKNTAYGHGVDINRNYPFAWGTCNGSSGSTWSDTYRGPSAGSELEAKALMALVARVQPTYSISYHSYSELVIYPLGCNGQRVATKDVVEPIGREMASKILRDSGSGTYDPGTAWELLYSVDGGDIDWMYQEYHVIPYVIEVNSTSAGFQPPFSLRAPTTEKLRPAWSYLLDKLDGSSVRGTITDAAGRAQPHTNVTVESLGRKGNDAAPYTWRVKADGTYHVVLNPGMYRLTFELNGRTQAHDVTIGATRTELDVQL